MAIVSSRFDHASLTLRSTAVVVVDAVRETIRNFITTVALKTRSLWQVVLQTLETSMPRYVKLVFDRIKGKSLSWQIIAYAALFAFVQLIVESNYPVDSHVLPVVGGAAGVQNASSQVPVLMRSLQGIVDTAVHGMNNSSHAGSALGFTSGSVLSFIGDLILRLCQGFIQSLAY